MKSQQEVFAKDPTRGLMFRPHHDRAVIYARQAIAIGEWRASIVSPTAS